MRGRLVLVGFRRGQWGRVGLLCVHRVDGLVGRPRRRLSALLRGRLLLLGRLVGLVRLLRLWNLLRLGLVDGFRVRLGGGLANDRGALGLGRRGKDRRAGVFDGRCGRVRRVPRLLLLQEPQRRHVSGGRNAWLRWPRPGGEL